MTIVTTSLAFCCDHSHNKMPMMYEVQGIPWGKVQWVLNYLNPDYLNSQLSESLDVAMFSAAAEKDVLVAGVLLQEKAKLLYERLFPDATTPFSASTGFRSRFTTSELAE